MSLNVYTDWLGIREEDCPPDHYQLLRLVEFEDDPNRIQANYKKLNAHVRKYATGQYLVESQDLMNELAKAMLCLTDPSRKRDYDESLGREVEPETTELGNLPVSVQLVEQGLLTKEQVGEVEGYAGPRGLSFRDAAVQMKLIDVETATQAYANELGRSYVDLSVMVPDEETLDQIPRNLARRESILPLFVDDDVVLVACADEPSPELEEEIRLRFGKPMRAAIAAPRAINEAIAEHYAKGKREKATQAATSTVETEPASAKKKKEKKKPSELTDEERQQRKQIGILMMCWGIIIPAVLDNFVLAGMMQWTYSVVLTLLIAPAVIIYVLKFYWK